MGNWHDPRTFHPQQGGDDVSERYWFQITGATIGMIGSVVVAVHSNWWIVLGIIVMMWGNNMQQAHGSKP